MEFLAFQNSFN